MANLKKLKKKAKGKKKTVTKKKAPAQVKRAPKGSGIGALARELIAQGLSNEDVLKGIKKKHPAAATSMSSVNWYRNDMRKTNKKIKTAREVTAKAKKAF